MTELMQDANYLKIFRTAVKKLYFITIFLTAFYHFYHFTIFTKWYTIFYKKWWPCEVIEAKELIFCMPYKNTGYIQEKKVIFGHLNRYPL